MKILSILFEIPIYLNWFTYLEFTRRLHILDAGELQEAIGLGIQQVERQLTRRQMECGFRIAYQNLHSTLQGAGETLRNLRMQNLPSRIIATIMSPLIETLYYSWENISINLGTTANFIETVKAGVPPSSSNTYRVLPSSGPQRPRQRIQAPPPPPPVASPPAPPAEQGYGWMHHMNHVLEYIWDNKLYIAGGVLAGLTLGGVGAVAGTQMHKQYTMPSNITQLSQMLVYTSTDNYVLYT
jgi:hypothetical protein